ncbi:MAG: helix-turn-helix transcriptional regulator [Ruminococcus sp.]|nr:helix-turn-helix transcriptional regulator [Ruminococcus sp.]
MYEDEKFAKRLAQLRMAKGVSAREMSLALGQCNSYINRIENGKSLPSMTVFFYICEYFGLTPEQFFSYGSADPVLSAQLAELFLRLSPPQSRHVISIIQDILG